MYTYKASVVKVVDGDTIIIDIDLGFNVWLRNQSVRLNGVDAPEKRTRNPIEKKAGLLASKFLSENLKTGEIISVVTYKANSSEKYGRILADIVNSKGENLNNLLIEKRYAVKYIGQNKEMIKAIHEANWKFLQEKGEI
jgi:micrococcal nuclease